MKLSGLTFALGLILALLARTEGQNWSINVTRNIHATPGSNVTVQCWFDCPLDLKTGNVKIFWKRSVTTYVFHANDTRVLEMYRGKTKLIGKKEQGNCSLVIQNIREDDLQIYLRVNVNESEYSFKNDSVRIKLSVANQQGTMVIICVAVLVPVVLVASLLAGGIFWRLKHKRATVLRGEDSRQAKFRRTLSNPATRMVLMKYEGAISDSFFLNLELPCHFSEDARPKQGNEMCFDAQEINDPIYINVESKVPPEWTHERTTNNESIYENVDGQILARGCS